MAVSDGWRPTTITAILFVATFDFKKGANYPDFQQHRAILDRAWFEFETLGPLVKIQPGESTEHV